MLSQTKNIVIGLAITFMAVTTASAETYLVDPAASEMAFNIRHTVGFNSGFVRKFSGEVDIRKYELRDVSLKADMTSITTFNEVRDPIILSEDFFHVEKYPQAEIRSRKIEPGFMTASVEIKGIKQDVLFYYQFHGLGKNERGQEIAVVTLQGRLNKKDFDLSYSSLTREGNENIGATLDLYIKLEAVVK